MPKSADTLTPINRRLRAAAIAAGYSNVETATQALNAELPEHARISTPTYQRIASGKILTENDRLRLGAAAAAFDCPLEWLEHGWDVVDIGDRAASPLQQQIDDLRVQFYEFRRDVPHRSGRPPRAQRRAERSRRRRVDREARARRSMRSRSSSAIRRFSQRSHTACSSSHSSAVLRSSSTVASATRCRVPPRGGWPSSATTERVGRIRAFPWTDATSPRDSQDPGCRVGLSSRGPNVHSPQDGAQP